MKTVVITKIERLTEEINTREVYIYGAKFCAVKLWKRLMKSEIEVKAFLVSERYENVETLQGISVLKIEQEKDEHFPTVIVAMGTNTVWGMEEELKQYHIDKLILLHPALMNMLDKSNIISDASVISEDAVIEDGVNIMVDETSSIEIEPYAYIKSGTNIVAENGSHIKIGKCVTISEDNIISCYECGKIDIGNNSIIGENGIFSIKTAAVICVGKSVNIDKNATIGSAEGGSIRIGGNTTIGSNLFLGAVGTKISIGEKNMFSYYVKLEAGSHHLTQKDKGDVLHRESISTGEHVWIGMGATLLPGASVGSGTVVGANSLVNRKIPINVTCAGNPVKVLRENIEWNR